jgi:hypothetical protein
MAARWAREGQARVEQLRGDFDDSQRPDRVTRFFRRQ